LDKALLAVFSDDQIQRSELQLDEVMRKIFLAHNLYTAVEDEYLDIIKRKAEVDAEFAVLKSQIRYLENIMKNLHQAARRLDVR
jgi:hypothetical protein